VEYLSGPNGIERSTNYETRKQREGKINSMKWSVKKPTELILQVNFVTHCSSRNLSQSEKKIELISVSLRCLKSSHLSLVWND
jgi:hypothetical protein